MTSAWFIIIPAALLLWALIAFFPKMPKEGRLPVAAAMALGLAGYSWQGMPDLPGAPVEKKISKEGFGEVIDRPLGGLTDAYGPAARFIALSDAFARQGSKTNAAQVLYGATMRYGDNADVWVAYGNALANASEGVMTPAAVMAFQRAREINAAHPGPQLFLGLAAAQREDWATARKEWQGLLDRSPENAPWRADLEARLKMVDQAEGAGAGAGAAKVEAGPAQKQ